MFLVIRSESMLHALWNCKWYSDLSYEGLYLTLVTFEPEHDKNAKMTCAPNEDTDQPGHPPRLIKSLRCPYEEALGP